MEPYIAVVGLLLFVGVILFTLIGLDTILYDKDERPDKEGSRTWVN